MVACPVCGEEDFRISILNEKDSEEWKIYNHDHCLYICWQMASIFELNDDLLEDERLDPDSVIFDLCMNCGTAFTQDEQMSVPRMPMNEYVLQLVAYRAHLLYGGIDGKFNSACFSCAFEDTTGLLGTIDGLKVEAILCGRKWVKQLDDCHWQLV